MESRDSDIEDGDDIHVTANIQLGFIQKNKNQLFLSKNWAAWDGGKVGGRPVNGFNIASNSTPYKDDSFIRYGLTLGIFRALKA